MRNRLESDRVKLICLMRHAKSDWNDTDKRDFDRGLNNRGRRGAALMGAHIRDHGVKFGKVIASPAERVVRTLDAALPEIEPKFDSRLYLASSETLMDVLREQDDAANAVLLVGHNPGLQDLILKLVALDKENALFDEAKVKLPTACFVTIAVPADSWAQLREESGEITHLARPRDLDPELGPEH